MSTDREVTRIVRSWLEEGATALPDRVLDAVLDQVPATPQRRSVWPVRRYADVNNMLKVAVSAAAVVVVAVIGVNLLPGSGGPGASTPTPVPTVTPTPAPSPSASPKAALGPLDPGTYRIADPNVTAVPFSFTVPAGWSGRSDGYIYKNAEQADELGLFTYVVTHVYADACKSDGALTEVGPSVDDLVRALEDQVDSEASAPADVTLGGHPAKRIDMSIPADLDLSTCRHPDQGIQIWADPAETDFFALPADPAGVVGPVSIADVDGARVVFVISAPPGTSTTDMAELQAIIDSITFEP